jgi:hypothetical protein
VFYPIANIGSVRLSWYQIEEVSAIRSPSDTGVGRKTMTFAAIVQKLEAERYDPSVMEDHSGRYIHLSVSDPAGDAGAGEESRREIRRLIPDRHWQIQWDGDSDGFGEDATSDLRIRRRG